MDAVSGVNRDDIVDGIDLGWFGIEAPPIPCLSIAYQMAQKLHDCTDPNDGEGPCWSVFEARVVSASDRCGG